MADLNSAVVINQAQSAEFVHEKLMRSRVVPINSTRPAAGPPSQLCKIRALGICRDGPLWVVGLARRVIQTAKPETRIMHYELTDYEWAAIKASRPNKPRSV